MLASSTGRRAGQLGHVEGIDVVDQAVIDGERLGVGQRDAAGFAGRDREDVRLHRLRADVFEQRRVAVLAHDLVVDAARFAGVEDLRLDRACR